MKIMQIEKLLRLYRKLLETIELGQKTFSEENISVFNFSKGARYNNKLLVVGWAVNGWNNYKKHEVTQKILEVENNIQTDDLQWVSDQWGDTINYNINKSAFWRISNKIARNFDDELLDNLSTLSYTNLYKISKVLKGNPLDKLCELQLGICKENLIEEIKILNPDNIIFLTGWGWAQWFLKGNTRINLTSKPKNKYVEYVGNSGKIKIIVGQHPQGKSETEHLKEILAEID